MYKNSHVEAGQPAKRTVTGDDFDHRYFELDSEADAVGAADSPACDLTNTELLERPTKVVQK